MIRSNFLATTTLLFGAASFVVLPGCSSNDGGASMAESEMMMMPDHAVMCPECETVWTTKPSRRGPRQLSRMNSSKEMTCPTCEEMASAQLLSDGDVQMHECPTCKVTPVLMETGPRPTRIRPGGRGVR